MARRGSPNPLEYRTGIYLEEIRLTSADGFVPREIVKTTPTLTDSSLITMPNATVFYLDEIQSQAMERLWGLATTSYLAVTPFALEGGIRLRSHYQRERSDALRRQKLAQVRQLHGKCVCEICGLGENSSRYPTELAQHIFEVHHRLPLSNATSPVPTTLEDLAVICANCHRAVHATRDVEGNFAALTAVFHGNGEARH